MIENVVIMVSEGYPLRFSANNTKSRYLALGLREAGCKVALCDSVFGTKGMTAKQRESRKKVLITSFFHDKARRVLYSPILFIYGVFLKAQDERSA